MRVAHYHRGDHRKPALDRLFDEIIAEYIKTNEYLLDMCDYHGHDPIVNETEMRKRVAKWRTRISMIKSCQERKEAKLIDMARGME